MASTQNISLRVPVVLLEAADREALRLKRSRSWVLVAWIKSGQLRLMPSGVDSGGEAGV